MMVEEAHIIRLVFGLRDIGEKQIDISRNKTVVLNTSLTSVISPSRMKELHHNLKNISQQAGLKSLLPVTVYIRRLVEVNSMCLL